MRSILTSHVPRILILGMIAFGLMTCQKKVSSPEYNSPYDETSTTYVPTPSLNTAPVSDILALSAKSGGTFENDYGKPVTAKGVCWSLTQNPVLGGSCSNEGPNTTSFASNLTNLLADTLYYVRAYATNEAGTIYGGQRSFRTRDGKPVFSGGAISAVSSSGSTISITIDSDGGDAITARGVCYSTQPDPTTAGTCVASGNGTGSYSVTLTGLEKGTAYFIRPYATNSVMTGYGAQVSFVTSAEAVVQTVSVGSLTWKSAVVSAEVTFAGTGTVISRGVCYSRTGNPSLTDTCLTAGTGTGSFSISLSNLSPGTDYVARAFATNLIGTSYGVSIPFSTSRGSGVVSDVDGNMYTTIQIGTQEFIVDNLRTTRYRDGTAIPNVINSSDWVRLGTGAWSSYENTSQFEQVYGKLYNWFAVADVRGICPVGWHVPTDSEWTKLSNALSTDVGFKMKSSSGWPFGGNGSNSSGFAGIPGGTRIYVGSFIDIERGGYWWSSSQADTGTAWFRGLYDGSRDLYRGANPTRDAFSVRCIRD